MPREKKVQVERTSTLEVRTPEDVVKVRQEVRNRTAAAGFGLVDQTKFVTAASEIARNTIDHGGGGTVRIETLQQRSKRGVRLTFEDHGPGIADVKLAMQDGYSTAGGLGMGLPGAILARQGNKSDTHSLETSVSGGDNNDLGGNRALPRSGSAQAGGWIRVRAACQQHPCWQGINRRDPACHPPDQKRLPW